MPFTASHVAAVLPAARFPLLRDPLVLSAFVIGSMSPDVPYFVPYDVWWAWGHSWTGLVVMDIPVTLALVAGFWLLLAAPLRALAPERVRARLPHKVLAAHRTHWPRTIALLTAGAGIGAATHIIWDGFTHGGRFGVMAIPMLQEPDVLGPLAAYRVLQYTCSAIGLALIAWSLINWYRRTPPAADAGRGLSWRWQSVCVTGLVVAGLAACWSVRGLVPQATDLYGLRDLLYESLTRSVAGMAAVVFIAAMAARVALLRIPTASR